MGFAPKGFDLASVVDYLEADLAIIRELNEQIVAEVQALHDRSAADYIWWALFLCCSKIVTF